MSSTIEPSNLIMGMNGRFFPNNWRPALTEIAFAASAGFKAIQFPGKEEGLNEAYLGSSFASVHTALSEAGITAVMEILIFINEEGLSKTHHKPLAILEANLEAIKALPCRYVHWHLAPVTLWSAPIAKRVEESLVSQFSAAVELSKKHGFRFAFEQNEPRIGLFSSPEACKKLLDAVSELGLVWDLNHSSEAQRPDFERLISKMTMLHVSDTPLPELNHHLPLGLGKLDFNVLCKTLKTQGFSGPAILEIGGLPRSGGYGKDSDEALIKSLEFLEKANEA